MSKPNLERGKVKKRELSPTSQALTDELFTSVFVRIPMPYWKLMTDDEARVLAYFWGMRDLYERTDQLSKGGAFWCTAKTLEEALQIPRSRQFRILERLKLRGYIKVELRGMPQKRFIRLNRRLITEDVAQSYDTGLDEVLKKFRRNPSYQEDARKKAPSWGQFC